MPVSRILFLTGGNPDAAFVQADLQILRQGNEVELIETGGRPAGRVAALVRACGQVMLGRTDLVYVWFAGVSYAPAVALACRIAAVPMVLVTGGADVANCPEVDFGDARIWWRRVLVRFALEHASVVLAFSGSAQREIARFAAPPHIEVNAPAIQFDGPTPGIAAGGREDMVLTVSSINALSVRQKGLDTFVRAAAALPSTRFVLIGRHSDAAAVASLRRMAPPNVEFPGTVRAEDLQQYYARARVYAQLSAHEGFGLAAAEARAAGCRVVATDRGSLPEVLGAAASYVPFGDVTAAVEAIARALGDRSPLPDVSADFQQRFGRAARHASLRDLVARLAGPNRADVARPEAVGSASRR